MTSGLFLDQNQLLNESVLGVLKVGSTYWEYAQSFTPTQSDLNKISLYKLSTLNTPVGNFEISLRNDNSGVPSASKLYTITYTLSQWNALTDGEVEIPLKYILTVGTKYWIVLRNTGGESGGNVYRFSGTGLSTYAGGNVFRSTNGGSTWSDLGSENCIYFKTFYRSYGTIDQSNTATNTAYFLIGRTTASALGGDKIASQFIPTSSNISSISLALLKNGNPVDNLVVELQTDSAGAPSGTVLTSKTVSVSSNYSYHNISLSNNLTIGNTYWVVVYRTGSTDDTNYYSWGASAGSAGQALKYTGSWETMAGDPYGVFQQYSDYTGPFPVYVHG